jgi:hypothetical protein
MVKSSNSNNLLLTTLIGTALAARFIYVLNRDALIDDVYITFRYAQNILQGEGIVYNLGESVYGASSPLYTFLFAGIAALFSKDALSLLAPWIGSLSLIGCVVVLWRSLPLTLFARTVMAIGLLSYPRIFYASVGGMEECAILFLMGLSIAAHLRRRPFWLGVICALLFMTKIDTLVWVACIFLVESISEKKFPWKVLLVALIVSLPWTLYGLAQYGSIIPHTVEAKRIAYVHPGGLKPLDAVLFTVPEAFTGSPLVVLLYAVVVYGTLGIALYRSIKTKDLLFLLFPLYCLGYTVLLFFSGTSLGLWERWTVPHWGMFLVTFGYVLSSTGSLARLHLGSSLKHTVLITLLLLHIGGLSASFIYPFRMSPDPKSSREVGTWLRGHATPNQSVLLEPIGLIGYLSNLYVHDFIGLISPQVTQARKVVPSSNRWYFQYIRQWLPTFIVLREREVHENEFMYGGYGDAIFLPTEKKWFDDEYALVFQTAHGSATERLLIYANKHQTRQPEPVRAED